MGDAGEEPSLRLAGQLLGRMAGRFDERRLCLALIFTAGQEGRPYDITSLAAAMGLSRASLGRLVAALAAKSEIRTTPDPADRRRVLLSLTPQGRRVAEAELRFMDNLIAETAIKRQAQSAHLIRPVKSQEIGDDQAIPIIRRLSEWSRNGAETIPLDLLDALYVCNPRFDNPSKTVIRHWGRDMRTGGVRAPSPNSVVSDVISADSTDYYRLLAQHWAQGLQSTVMHQIEIDWDTPYKTYQRIIIPHPRFGLFACSRFLDA